MPKNADFCKALIIKHFRRLPSKSEARQLLVGVFDSEMARHDAHSARLRSPRQGNSYGDTSDTFCEGSAEWTKLRYDPFDLIVKRCGKSVRDNLSSMGR